ncbi:FxSxx-COOH system tetratricopeptide repeat protein [Dactylosporangium sp. CA-139066]|uniref:FxSxx-COOH system tetratricopeptide repeat protein n=1 Tax=Dactylosporangium sp. CA-139066 TaxID=3239930 RepID=UPI003D8ADBFF
MPQYLRLLDAAPARLFEDAPPADYGRAITATWRLALDRLHGTQPAAAALLEVCACLAPEPVPVDLLLGSERALDELAGLDPDVRDPIVQARLVREVAASALARLDPQSRTLQVKRLVQAVVRDHLGPDGVAGRRRLARLMLADADPHDPGDPVRWPAYAVVLAHVEACRATDDDDPAMRQLIVDLVRYLYRRGDPRTGLDLATTVLERWRRFGDDDPVTLRLRAESANSLRMMARYAEAAAVNADVLARLTRISGPDDPITLNAANSVGADLRIAADYPAAYRLGSDTLDRYRRVLGPDHQRTLYAANNLAVSLRLLGDHRRASALQADALRRQRRLNGDTHPDTLHAATSHGIDLLWVGDLAESRRMLTWSYEGHLGTVGPDHPGTLLAATSLATALRWLGRRTAAKELSEATLDRCRRLLARGHLYTLICLAGVSADRSAAGRHDRARGDTEEAMKVSPLDAANPFMLVLRGNRAGFLSRLGEHGTALAESAAVAEALRERLGPAHPFSIAADVNHADDLARTGEPAAAAALIEEAYEAARATLGEEHPHTLVAGGNLAATPRAGNGTVVRRTVLGAAVARLGADHPVTLDIRAGRRARIILEPNVP